MLWLFAPFHLLESLGITCWRVQGKPYLGSIFVISLAVVGCHCVAVTAHFAANKYRVLLSRRAAKARLKCLTSEEQNLLAPYLEENTRVQKFSLRNGVVAGLQDAYIIYPAVPQADGYEFPFAIEPWVWKYLKKNPPCWGERLVTPRWAKSADRSPGRAPLRCPFLSAGTEKALSLPNLGCASFLARVRQPRKVDRRNSRRQFLRAVRCL